MPMETPEKLNLTIKPLTPELAADYFDFFENRAFTDASPYRCYCQVYQMTRDEALAVLEQAKERDPGRVAREAAERQIASGALRGYLAYADGVAIGWCNANDRSSYPADPAWAVPFHAPQENREKAVVCFEIAPEYRGKGVATALLRRVLEDARAKGYAAVVGFPVLRAERFEWDFHGPLRLYEMAGFVKASEPDPEGRVLMRKELA